MEPWQHRVIKESEDLGNKIVALGIFMKTDRFTTLDRENQGLMRVQYQIMVAYEEVLGARIRRFT